MSKKALIILFTISFVLLAFTVTDLSAQSEDAGTAEPAVAIDAAPIAAGSDKPAEPAEPEVVETGAPAEPGLADQAKGVFTSFKGGKVVLGLGFLAMLLGSLGRWFAGMKWGFWKSKKGGYAIAAISGVSTLGFGIVTSGSFSMDVLAAAALVVSSSMGLHGPGKAIGKALKGAQGASA